MSDNELDDDLLALAGDDSGSENEDDTKFEPMVRSPSPPARSPPKAPEQPPVARPPKGVAQRKVAKSTKSTAMKSKPRSGSVEDGERSSAGSPESLGSGAMSESESDAAPIRSSAAATDEAHFPIEGKFRSEKDKAEIMALPEIKREEILAERAQELEKKQQDAQLRRLLQARERDEARLADKRKRKSDLVDDDDGPTMSSKKARTSETLEVYKQKRAQRGEQRKREEDRRRHNRKSTSPRGSSSVDADGESDVEWDDRPTKATARDEPPAQLVDFQRARVGRSNFAKVCFLPPFRDAIRGCFCRISIGPNRSTGENMYRMCQIKGFTEGKPYAMEGSNGRTFVTDQYVIAMHGKAEREWPFLSCSDSKITDAEFDRYKQSVEIDKMKVPTLSFIQGKIKDINELLEYRMTDEDIQAKMQRSGMMQSKYASIERHRITNERNKALADQDEATVARLDQELAALDGPKLAFGTSLSNIANKAAPKPPSQQDRLAALNRANRKANMEEVRKAQIAERRAEAKAQAAVARGEAVANPFARVKTRAKVHHDSNGDTLTSADHKTLNELFGDSDRSRAGTPMTGTNTPRKINTPRGGTPQPGQKPKVSGLSAFRKKAMDDDVIGAMDLGIEIDIV